MNAAEIAGRAFLLAIAGGLISTVIACWIAYMVLKAAIRDGIKESGLITALQSATREPTMDAGTRPMTLGERR